MSASRTASWIVLAIAAPAASYSASGTPAEPPAPDWITTSAPRPLIFFTVSGVAATRGSPAPASRATAMRIHRLRESGALSGGGKGEGEHRHGKRHIAGGLRPAPQALRRCDRGNQEDRCREKPMAIDASDRQPKQDVDDVNDGEER